MATPEAHRMNRWLRTVGSFEAFDAFATLVDDLCEPDAAVFAVDGDRTVIYWSDGAERLLGFTRDSMIGQHCLKGSRCETCMLGCGLSEHGHLAGIALTMHREDGGSVAVRKTARAFYGPDGAFLGGVEILVPAESPARTLQTRVQGDELPVDRLPDPGTVVRFHGLISQDTAMHRAFQVVRNVAETDASVLIRGESGTGKELAARAIHAESHRRDGPFLAVNCAALAPTLLESELFGHVRGAFTGAVKDRAGLFERADGGTLFLDEVAELSLDLQAKLLRVLQDHTVVPVGGSTARKVDIRIVAATHTGLRQKVKEGTFREDLMYRLRVVPVFLPALRDRRGDIEVLLWHFIEQHNERGPRRIRTVAPDTMRALLDHEWPGNVRELLNVVQYAFAVGRGTELRAEELPPEFREQRPRSRLQDNDPEREAQAIRDALARANGHVGRAAELLGMSRPTFWRHRKRLGI